MQQTNRAMAESENRQAKRTQLHHTHSWSRRQPSAKGTHAHTQTHTHTLTHSHALTYTHTHTHTHTAPNACDALQGRAAAVATRRQPRQLRFAIAPAVNKHPRTSTSTSTSTSMSTSTSTSMSTRTSMLHAWQPLCEPVCCCKCAGRLSKSIMWAAATTLCTPRHPVTTDGRHPRTTVHTHTHKHKHKHTGCSGVSALPSPPPPPPNATPRVPDRAGPPVRPLARRQSPAVVQPPWPRQGRIGRACWTPDRSRWRWCWCCPRDSCVACGDPIRQSSDGVHGNEAGRKRGREWRE